MANRKALTPQQARSLVGVIGTGQAKTNDNNPVLDGLDTTKKYLQLRTLGFAKPIANSIGTTIGNLVYGQDEKKLSDTTQSKLKSAGITDKNFMQPYSQIHPSSQAADPYAGISAASSKNTNDKNKTLYNELLNKRIKAYHPDVNSITNDVTKQYDAQYNPMINRQHEQAKLAGQDVAGYFNQASDLTEHDLSGQRKFMGQQSQSLTKDLNRLSALPGGGKDRALLNNAGLAANASRTVGSSADQLLGNMANAGRAAGAFLATNARSTENAKADDMERQRQSAIDSAIQDRINNAYQRNSAMQSNNIDLAAKQADYRLKEPEANPTGQKAVAGALNDINNYAASLGQALQRPDTMPAQAQALINQYGITDKSQIDQIIAASKAGAAAVNKRIWYDGHQNASTTPQGG